MGIGVLGPLTVNGRAAGIGPRDRVVLSALALHPGDVVTSERLADALWGEHPPASSGKVVQGCIVRLRRVLGTTAIETTPQGYRLVVSGADVDAQEFDRLLRRARELLTLGEPEHAAYVAEEALALWRGHALVDLEEWEAGRIEAGRLEQMRLDAEELRIDAALRAGRYRDVLSDAQALLARAPMRERRWALLALAEYQAGRQAESLRTLRQARAMLANELGLDPGPDLIALEQAILRQDPSLIADALPDPSTTCPYQGLLPYGVDDADSFFGRDEDVATCRRRLAAAGSLTLAGPSGSGKSSLVRAGIAAALQRDGRRVVIVTPGARPLDALTAIPSTGPAAVLVVDQCEEAITLCESEDARAKFFATLVKHAVTAPVVIAVRADHLGEISEYREFAELVERGLYLVRPLAEKDLRDAIEGPARLHGLLLEPGLVDLLIREAEGEPGALPLLSHALAQTWARREGRTLTVAGYRETGGIRGAVAQSAERVYEQTPPEQRQMLRDLLLRLVTPTPEGEPVRTRVPLRMVAASPEHERLIGLLVDARLVTSDDEALELSHEALTRAWPRLQTWLDDDVQGQRILRHVSVAADTWDTMDRPDSELYRGTRLAQALQWQETAHPGLNAAERDFLAASRRLAEAEQESADERARHQVRVNHRLRGLLAGVGVLLVCALVASLLAVRGERRADEAAVAADARRVGAQALIAEDPDESLLLAVEGVRLDNSQDTRANLLAAMAKTPALVATFRSDTGIVSAAVSPDNRIVAVTHSWADVEFFDIETRESLGRYDELTAASRVAFRPDGKQLAVGNQPDPDEPSTFDPMPLRLVDPATFEEQSAQLGGQPERAFAVAPDYSADGRFLAASFDLVAAGDPIADAPVSPESSRVEVWDVTKPEQPVMSTDLPGPNYYPALSPDGSVLYVGHQAPASVTAYEVASGRELMSSALAGWMLTLSPDGTVLAAADGAEVSLIDAATLQERIRLRRHTGDVQNVEFSADGALLASGADDNTALVWNVASGEIRQELTGHSGSVWGVAFASDDSLLTSSLDGVVYVWDIEGTRRFVSRSPSAEPIPVTDGWAWLSNEAIAHARFEMPGAPGQQAAAVLFREVATGTVTAFDTRHGSWGWFAWRPDGRRFVTAGADQFVRVWDWPTLQLVAEQPVLQDDVGDIDFTGDGTRVVLADSEGRVFTLDAESLEPAGPTIRLGTELGPVRASPDNRTAIVFTSGEDYFLIDLDQGRVLRRGEFDLGTDGGGNGEFSPDGRRVAVVHGERVRVLDVASGDWLGPPVPARIDTISYAPDGLTFATDAGDGTVSLWDGNTGSLLGTVVPGAADPGLWTHFLPDGHSLLIASHAGDVFTWDTRPAHWVDFACRVAGRNFTTEEWNAIFEDRPYLEDRPYHETCPQN